MAATPSPQFLLPCGSTLVLSCPSAMAVQAHTLPVNAPHSSSSLVEDEPDELELQMSRLLRNLFELPCAVSVNVLDAVPHNVLLAYKALIAKAISPKCPEKRNFGSLCNSKLSNNVLSMCCQTGLHRRSHLLPWFRSCCPPTRHRKPSQSPCFQPRRELKPMLVTTIEGPSLKP